MIEARIRKRLGAFTLDVDLELPARGITVLFGRSGAGKSSVIQAIAGAIRPDGGRIALADRTFFDAALKVDMPVHRRHVGFVFQDSRLFPHLSVRGNLTYGYRRKSGDHLIGFEDAVALLGISDLLDRRPHKLSGGERQRVAIGRALLAQPSLLLMDEPLSSLDPPRKSELLPYIEGLRDELRLPIIYVSHAIDEVVRLADHLVIMDAGRVLKSGPLLDVVSDGDVGPLIGRFEAGSVISCTVQRHDGDAGLSTLAFEGGELRVPLVMLAPGTALRVRIRSRDVAIALSRLEGVSITNQIRGTLESLTPREGPYVEAAINAGGTLLRSLITRESVERLDLVPGRDVWALIKSVAFDGRSVGFLRRIRGARD